MGIFFISVNFLQYGISTFYKCFFNQYMLLDFFVINIWSLIADSPVGQELASHFLYVKNLNITNWP